MNKGTVRSLSIVLAAVIAILLVVKVGIGATLGCLITAFIMGLVLSFVVGLFIDETKVDEAMSNLGIPLDFTELCMWIVGLTIAIPDIIKSFF